MGIKAPPHQKCVLGLYLITAILNILYIYIELQICAKPYANLHVSDMEMNLLLLFLQLFVCQEYKQSERVNVLEQNLRKGDRKSREWGQDGPASLTVPDWSAGVTGTKGPQCTFEILLGVSA